MMLLTALTLGTALLSPPQGDSKLKRLPPGVKPFRTIAWLPPFAPLISEPERATWRAEVLAALNKPQIAGAYVPIAPAKVAAALKTLKIDPAAQNSTWDPKTLLAVGKVTGAKYVGALDLHPISPNVGANKELVAVTGVPAILDVATGKSLAGAPLYLTGPLPKPGKGSYSDGLPVAVRIAETMVPQAFKKVFDPK